MPIFDQSYRHYEGKIKGYTFRWWIITKRGIIHFLRRKWFLMLLFLTLILFLIRGIVLFISVYFPQVDVNIMDVKYPELFYYKFIYQQWFFLLIMSLITGSGLIANDLRYNALQLYLSKPIRRIDYVAGKLGIIAFFISLISLVPALMLFILRLSLSKDLSFIKQYYWIPISIIAFSSIIIIVTSFFMAAISSLFKSTRLAAIVFAIILLFSPATYQILNKIFHKPALTVVSFQNNLAQVGNMLFGIEPEFHIHWAWSLLVLIGIVILSIFILNKRVRGVEVAK